MPLEPSALDAGPIPVLSNQPDPSNLAELDPTRTGFALIGAGQNVSAGGDFNGDGIPDVVVTKRSSPIVYIAFGSAPGDADLTRIPDAAPGVLIEGDTATGWSANGAVQFVGDVNGDGFDDVAVFAARPDANGVLDSSAICVLFGSSTGGRVNLGEIVAGAGRGFAVEGLGLGAMQAADDVNGDGLDDLVIGAPARGTTGMVYIVYGKTDATVVSLDALEAGDGGYAHAGAPTEVGFGTEVAGLGDVNGDSVPDIAVNAYGGGLPMTVHVLFGRRPSGASAPGGFDVVLPENDPTYYQATLARGNDINADGRNDLLIGLWNYGVTTTSFVVFGKEDSAAVQTSQLAAGSGGGFAISGALGSFPRPTPSRLGLAAIGDINADGREDFIVGDALASTTSVYVVFGKADFGALDGLLLTPQTGFSIPTFAAEDEIGTGVSRLGDVNADGVPDYVVSTPNPYPLDPPQIEAVRVVYGTTRFAAP